MSKFAWTLEELFDPNEWVKDGIIVKKIKKKKITPMILLIILLSSVIIGAIGYYVNNRIKVVDYGLKPTNNYPLPHNTTDIFTESVDDFGRIIMKEGNYQNVLIDKEYKINLQIRQYYYYNLTIKYTEIIGKIIIESFTQNPTINLTQNGYISYFGNASNFISIQFTIYNQSDINICDIYFKTWITIVPSDNSLDYPFYLDIELMIYNPTNRGSMIYLTDSKYYAIWLNKGDYLYMTNTQSFHIYNSDKDLIISHITSYSNMWYQGYFIVSTFNAQHDNYLRVD